MCKKEQAEAKKATLNLPLLTDATLRTFAVGGAALAAAPFFFLGGASALAMRFRRSTICFSRYPLHSNESGSPVHMCSRQMLLWPGFSRHQLHHCDSYVDASQMMCLQTITGSSDESCSILHRWSRSTPPGQSLGHSPVTQRTGTARGWLSTWTKQLNLKVHLARCSAASGRFRTQASR